MAPRRCRAMACCVVVGAGAGCRASRDAWQVQAEARARPLRRPGGTHRSPSSASASCRRLLRDGLTGGVDYYSEYHRSRRGFQSRGFRSRLPRLPAREIPGQEVRPRHRDARHRARLRRPEQGELFPATPVVFFVELRLEPVASRIPLACRHHSTSGGTLDAGLALQPDTAAPVRRERRRRAATRHMTAGAHASSDRSSLDSTVTYLTGLPTTRSRSSSGVAAGALDRLLPGRRSRWRRRRSSTRWSIWIAWRRFERTDL